MSQQLLNLTRYRICQNLFNNILAKRWALVGLIPNRVSELEGTLKMQIKDNVPISQMGEGGKVSLGPYITQFPWQPIP